MDNLLSLDHLLLQKINIVATHPLLDSFFAFWTDVHKTLPFKLALAAFLVWLIATKRWKLILLLCVAALVATVVDFVNGDLIKPIFDRPRPFESNLPFEVILRGPGYGGLAFPSSHSATSFAIATFLGYHFRKLAPYFVGFACLTSYSRIYCGVHFPSDAIAGACVGITFGLAAAYAYARQAGSALRV